MNKYQEFYINVVKNMAKENISFGEPLKHHTFTKIGGKADIFITPANLLELQSVIQQARQFDIPITVIGNGSNVIVRDGGLRGITLCLVKMNHVNTRDNMITAECGAALIEVSQQALHSELTGLEFACGIPGTIGGALYMNAGAYGGEISDVLERATVLTLDGELLTLTKDEFSFGYRRSIFKEKGYIILEAEFHLEKAAKESIENKMIEFTEARSAKQPLEYPSCGSVFKRPPGMFAGKLIRESGLQGIRIGGAEVSTKHAGFIVNVNHASSKDYTNLIALIQRTVKEKFHVDLEPEVIILGEEE